MTNPNFRDLIADDSWASTFQSVGQYRTALLKAFDASVSRRADNDICAGLEISRLPSKWHV